MKRNDCRFCKSQGLEKFLELGLQPLAGGFLLAQQLSQKEGFYPLGVYFCKNCKLVQTTDVIEKDTLFTQYFYAPHSLLSPHFTSYAKEIADQYNLKGKFVVEFGSNIGMMLKPLRELGVNAIGVEPAKNIAAIANEHGLTTINDFFNEKVAKQIAEENGKADMIVANNVFAHIDDLDEIMKGIKVLLKDDGIYVFENHYLGDTVDMLQYDDVYHEHLNYYSLIPLIPFFEKFGMYVFDVKKVKTHGGSIRVFVANQKRKAEPSVAQLLEEEKKAGLDRLETFIKFGEKVHQRKKELTELLASLKTQGKKIIGYGAPARGNTLLNFCKIDNKILDYIIDDSPLRQGKYTPGTRIPILAVERFRKDQPDYALLLAYGGYTDSILQKESEYIKKGGKFIIPLPEIKIVPK